MLIINADDWGRDAQTTDKTYDCVVRGTVSSVSAMVFMEDSARAAAIAGDSGISTGLHLNLTTEFSVRSCSATLLEHQRRTRRFLGRHSAAQVLFHPGLKGSFEYLVKAQCEEYARLYGGAPQRIDGHHHMHLCANVLFQELLPAGIVVRRNFSFQPGQKSALNRLYRGFIDSRLAKRYRLTDYFFCLPPIEPRKRLHDIFALGKRAIVEVETHAVALNEYTFLISGEIFEYLDDVPIARGYDLPGSAQGEGACLRSLV